MAPQLLSHLSISSAPDADVPRLAVRGELDMASAAQLGRAIEAQECGDSGVICIDVTELRFMDVSGVRTLLNAARRAGRKGRRLVVLNPQPSIQRLFSLTAVDQTLEVRFE